ncbi:hypothetical protein QQ045_006624 [Rhodiola kirilowii]
MERSLAEDNEEKQTNGVRESTANAYDRKFEDVSSQLWRLGYLESECGWLTLHRFVLWVFLTIGSLVGAQFARRVFVLLFGREGSVEA